MSVVHNYPEFKQPLDVLNRYEALGKICTIIPEIFFCVDQLMKCVFYAVNGWVESDHSFK